MPRKSAVSKPSARKSSSRKPSTAGRARKKAARKQSRQPADTSVRLQRLLASAGFGSRRQCEELIEEGRVDVDGTVVTKLGTTVNPSDQKVRVDGVLLKKQKLVYYAVNKPIGFVTTNRDPQGRPRVIDLVPPDERVFPVGRLDRNSEGLILLTNDGELAQKLTHPKFGVRKVYRVTVAGKVDPETMRQMRKGIYIAEGLVRVDGAKLLKSRSRSTELEIVLREGKNREIRRILARLGHKVQHLRRIAVGPLRLGDLPGGAYRVVSQREVEKLWTATEADASDGPPQRGKKRAGKKRVTGSSSRRPSKKKAPQRRSTSTPAVFSDESHTVGAVIGADSDSKTSSPSRTRGGTKRGAKKGKPTSAGRRGTKKKKSASRTGRTDRASSGGRKKHRTAKGKADGPKRTGRKRKRKN